MKHKIIPIMAAVVWGLCFFALSAQAKYGGGTGEPNDPYLIYDANQMNTIGLNEEDWDKHFKLMADIDLSGYTGPGPWPPPPPPPPPWPPSPPPMIADVDSSVYTETIFNIIGREPLPFTGVFDGNDHTISNFTYTSTGTSYIGLFGHVTGENAEIKDLGLIDPNVDAGTGDFVGSLVGSLCSGTINGCYVEGGSVTGSSYVGGLVGENFRGTITNCDSTGSVLGGSSVGGLVGWNYGTVSNCYSNGDVSGKYDVGGLCGANGDYGGQNGGTISNCYSTGAVRGSIRVGGLAGLNLGTVTNCYSGGSVTGINSVGGLVGDNYGKITNCDSSGDVSGWLDVGGLVGWNSEKGTITNCYSNSNIEGDLEVGGLAGFNRGTITNCYATASVSSNDDYVGGLVGRNGGTITNCYSASSVSGVSYVGGLAGYNFATITNCYSSGSVAGTIDVGGLVGSGSGYVINSYWDVETSGQDVSSGGEVKTTAQMMTASTFVHWGACGGVWTINEGVDYPRLSWEERPGEPIAGTVPLKGDGDSDSPYLVYTAEELNVIGQIPCIWDKHFKVMADIDLSQYTGTEFNIIAQFTGVFDGNGHMISNFTYDSNDTGYIGLFGYLTGAVKDLGLIDPNIDAGTGWYVGSLVGWLSGGTVTGCYVEDGSVTGDYRVGGLVGLNYGTISNCYSASSVSGVSYVGGMVGENSRSRTITSCYSTASVSGEEYVGGLAGLNYGTINDCYSTGSVTGDYRVGGLVGLNYGTISNCYSASSVSGDGFVGGLVGDNSRTISNCYSTGTVSGNSGVGGLVGHLPIPPPPPPGDQRATFHLKNGIHTLGSYGEWCSYSRAIINQYLEADVLGENDVGGLMGLDEFGGEVTASFWDVGTSGQTSSAGGTGLPTAEMQMQVTFTDAGWDFNTPVWTIDEGVNYPRLWWEFVPVLHVEPEITLGTSNTISWEPVVGDVEYYAECAEDADFTSIIYNSGWVTETSCDFIGLELGQRYWYSVKARNTAGIESQWSNIESSLQCSLSGAVETLLSPESLKNENMKNALLNKIDAALKMIEEGNYTGALSKLRNDILAKMNGCGEKGEPDKNDWIITCEEQSEQYPLVIETIEYVRGLMGECRI